MIMDSKFFYLDVDFGSTVYVRYDGKIYSAKYLCSSKGPFFNSHHLLLAGGIGEVKFSSGCNIYRTVNDAADKYRHIELKSISLLEFFKIEGVWNAFMYKGEVTCIPLYWWDGFSVREKKVGAGAFRLWMDEKGVHSRFNICDEHTYYPSEEMCLKSNEIEVVDF